MDLLKRSTDFQEDDQIQLVYPSWLQSVIVKTNNNKYYQITPEGDIYNKTYHDVIYDNGMVLEDILSQNQKEEIAND
jgi:hypothetical protein